MTFFLYFILGISVWKRSNWQYFHGCLLRCLYHGIARSHQKFQVAYQRARVFCHSYRGRAFMGGQATWSPQSSGKIAILNIKSIEMIMNGLYNVISQKILAYENIKQVQYRVMHKFLDMKWAIHGKLVHTSKKNVEKPNEKQYHPNIFWKF